MEREKHNTRLWSQLEVEIMVRYEIGQMPPYLIQRLRSKDRLERDQAKDEVAQRISRRFAGLDVYGPEAAGQPFPHIGVASAS